MVRKKVLIAGGMGHFGQLLVADLRRHVDCELIIADRQTLNLADRMSIEKALPGVAVAICAAGPFQTLPTTLAELCVSRGINYIDFADDRAFVRKVRALVPRQSNDAPAVCPAWSTVSALSGLLAHAGVAGATNVQAIYIHMAPGNRVPRGTGTIASLLYSVGRPMSVMRNGIWTTCRGWSEPRDFVFPSPIGVRRGYLVDVPDHELFPELFQARAVEFRTSSELRILNTAVSSLAWCVQAGIVNNWVSWQRVFQAGAALFGGMGHDWGGVGVEVVTASGRRRVSIVSGSGGQRIAVMPASVMTAELLSGSPHHGLVSPAEWLTFERLRDECRKREFDLELEDL